MNELETAFMEKLSDKAANMTPEEKKAMEVIQKAWADLSSSEKSRFILAYAKNPSQAIDHIMKSIKKEELDLGEDKEDLKEIIGKIIRRFSAAGRADAAEKKADKLEKKAKDRERLKKAKERIAAAKQAERERKQKERERKMKKEDLEEAKKPSDDEMIDVMGPAKNSKEAVKLIQKKYKMDAKTAEAEVKRLLKKLLGEERSMHKIGDPMEFKRDGKKIQISKKGGKWILTIDGKDQGKFDSEKDAMKAVDLHKESVELEEGLKTTHVVVDTAQGNKVVSTAAGANAEKNLRSSIASAERPPLNIKDKKTLKIVKLKKPVSDKKASQMVGSPLKEGLQNKSFKSLRDRLAGEEVEQIAESNMDALRKIVDDSAMGKINGVKIDMTTANMMLTVHKALNDKNKKALEGLINGDKAQFMRAHALVMKILSK